MKIIAYFAIFILFISFISCINNSKPDNDKDTTGKIIYPEENKQRVTVFGYGYMSGKSKTAVERFAINKARGSIAEQARGLEFVIEVKSNEVTFTADTGEVTLGGIKTEEKNIWQQSGRWEMFVIQSAKIDVEIPKGSGVVIKEGEGEGDDLSILLANLRVHAVQEAVMQNKELNTKTTIKGHLYLAFLEVTPLADKPGVSAKASFAIIFYY